MGIFYFVAIIDSFIIIFNELVDVCIYDMMTIYVNYFFLLLNLFVIIFQFIVYLKKRIISQIEVVFTFSFSIFVLLAYFSCLILLTDPFNISLSCL